MLKIFQHSVFNSQFQSHKMALKKELFKPRFACPALGGKQRPGEKELIASSVPPTLWTCPSRSRGLSRAGQVPKLKPKLRQSTTPIDTKNTHAILITNGSLFKVGNPARGASGRMLLLRTCLKVSIFLLTMGRYL